MTQPQGPSVPYQLLFADDADAPPSLPEAFRAIYPGDWCIPTVKGRPYIYSNFAMSRDGRISYNERDREEAYYITKANPHDRWLMALLRMRADALLVGDTTLKLEKYHFETSGEVCPWTAEFISRQDATAFTAQRKAEGYKPIPLLVVLSLDGNVDFNAFCFTQPDRHILFATTTRGVEKVRQIGVPSTVDVHELGAESVDLRQLVQLLHRDYAIRHLLCEGGARVFANFLNAGLIDEEFVTWCPTFVGRSHEHQRPSYTEGVAWMPEAAPYSKPISLHRGGDYIFMRTRCQYGK